MPSSVMRHLSLKPEVSGPLAEMEKAAIEAIGAERKMKASITVDADVALVAIRSAARAKRDFSGFCTVALADYDGRNPGPAGDTIELFAKLEVALARRPQLRHSLEKMARHANRAKRARIAA